jgi:hypothetical protein
MKTDLLAPAEKRRVLQWVHLSGGRIGTRNTRFHLSVPDFLAKQPIVFPGEF